MTMGSKFKLCAHAGCFYIEDIDWGTIFTHIRVLQLPWCTNHELFGALNGV